MGFDPTFTFFRFFRVDDLPSVSVDECAFGNTLSSVEAKSNFLRFHKELKLHYQTFGNHLIRTLNPTWAIYVALKNRVVLWWIFQAIVQVVV